MQREQLGLDQWAGDPLGIEPRLRLGVIARGGTGEHEARYPVGELARDHAADRSEAADGDASHWHKRASGMRPPKAALFLRVLRAPLLAHKCREPRVTRAT